jgi:hypothetical protein
MIGTMRLGTWYVQKFSSTSDELYFYPEMTLKNGHYSGIMVTLEPSRPRARPKSKKISVWQADLWKVAPDVPTKVLEQWMEAKSR